MIINFYFDSSAYFIVDDFLPQDWLEIFLQEIERLECELIEGLVMQGGKRVQNKIKHNKILTLASEHFIAVKFRERFWCPDITAILQVQRNRIFQNMFTPKKEKLQLSVYGDGDYYGPHKDGKSVTVNLFLHREPRNFEGGELVLHTEKHSRVIEFKNNRLLMFDGMTLHEVTPVRCSSKEYMDSRFSIQYWANRQ